MRCSPAALGFGTVVIGQSQTQLLKLINTGQSAATIRAIDSNSSDFTVSTEALPFALGAGQNTWIKVAFAPSSAGLVRADITFTSNATNSTLKLAMEGIGAQAVAVVAAPSGLLFGDIALGSQETLPVVLKNTSTAKVTVTSFQAVGTGFSVSAPRVPYILDAGQDVALNVTFAPKSGGWTGGDIQVYGPNLNVPLAGKGTLGTLTVSPKTLDFGNVYKGSTATLTTTLTATDASVTIHSATFNNPQFAIPGTSFPLTISAGQSIPLNLEFSPDQNGAASGTLTLFSNASDNKVVESLTGNGITPTVVLSWTPSTSPVVGYDVFRGKSATSYSKLNTEPDVDTTYTDDTVVSGSIYYYAVKAVNSSGEESNFSSPVEVAIP